MPQTLLRGHELPAEPTLQPPSYWEPADDPAGPRKPGPSLRQPATAVDGGSGPATGGPPTRPPQPHERPSRFAGATSQSPAGPRGLPAAWWAKDSAQGQQSSMAPLAGPVPASPTGPRSKAGPASPKQDGALQRCLGLLQIPRAPSRDPPIGPELDRTSRQPQKLLASRRNLNRDRCHERRGVRPGNRYLVLKAAHLDRDPGISRRKL